MRTRKPVKESDIQSAAMDLLLRHPKVAWAFVTTSGTLKGRNGHWMKLGFPGISDIIGQLRDGRLLAIEVKKPGEKPTQLQVEFLQLVEGNKGVSGWVNSPEEVLRILNGASH